MRFSQTTGEVRTGNPTRATLEKYDLKDVADVPSFLNPAKFMLKFHKEKCLYPICRICVDNCPMDRISIEPPIMAKPCIQCTFCAKVCPIRSSGDPDAWVKAMLDFNSVTIERKYSFETPPAPIPAKDIKEIINADIVVAGAGPAGLAAAVSAAEKGAKVVLLEKYHRMAAPGGPGAPFLGTRMQKEREGKPNITSGGLPAGMAMHDSVPIPTKEEIIQGLYKGSSGWADERMIRLWADKSGEVGDWLIDMANATGIFVSVGRFNHVFSKTPTVNSIWTERLWEPVPMMMTEGENSFC